MDSRVFSDPTIPAFFQATLKKLKVIPKKDIDGKVVFLVEGDEIDRALDELYSNAPVGVLDFIRCLKGLRSSIFALKGSRRS